MRARVARNVKDWNLPPSMDKAERLKFEATMEEVFNKFEFPENITVCPGHKNEISTEKPDKVRADFLFNDMTTGNHLTSSGVAND
jgi:arginine kinase